MVLLFISGCDNQLSKETGILKGVISIGPICPVETDPPLPACLPTAETYKAYPVSVWTLDGRKKITQLNPSLDGSFPTVLAPGKYKVLQLIKKFIRYAEKRIFGYVELQYFIRYAEDSP